jgi:hypothetical protein
MLKHFIFNVNFYYLTDPEEIIDVAPDAVGVNEGKRYMRK